MAARKKSKGGSLPPFAMVEAARRHIVHGEKQAKLAKEFGVNATDMSRAIAKVLEKHWLTVSAWDNFPNHFRVDEKSSIELTNRYDRVRTIHVLHLEIPQKGPASDDAAWSDNVHSQLGRYLGHHQLKPAITDDDTIGVSSGRGVYYTIQGIHPGVIRAENVTLMSLTGSFGNRAHSVNDPAIMDADTNVGLFAQAFGRMIHLQTTGREVVVSQGERRPDWFSEVPKRALIGLGVMEKTSRILSKESMLRGLESDLKRLKELTNMASRENYIPCADLCNYLVYIPPPKGMVVPKDSELQQLIHKINSRLFVIPFEKLLEIKGCWLAVGTARKAHALHHCLTRGLRVSGLCIDQALATELLRLSA